MEGAIHQAVTGTRRARYLEHSFSATAINLIRIDAWWNNRPLDHATIDFTRLGLTLAADHN